jgi:thiol-disulfide isomerase/thioredoxin
LAPKPTTDTWIWLLVLASAASVVGLAVVQGNRSETRLKGRPAPAISLPSLDGGKSSIQQGKVTLVDFWATWCAPCRASMPRVQKVWQEYQRSGVALYSVDTDDPGPDRDHQVREFLLKNQLSIPVVLDDGTASQAFSIGSLPTMLLVDRQGTIVWSHVGALNDRRETDLRRALDQALAP